MSKLLVTSIENSGIRMSNARLQPLITWLHFLNFFTIAVLCLVFLKIYKCLLLLYDWLFPFKQKIESPTIVVVGAKNDVNKEIVFQLSEKFNSEIIDFQDINDNFSMSKQKQKQSNLIYSHAPVSNKEIVTELSKYVEKIFGFVDILVIIQHEEPAENNSSHSFLTNLNKQLLAQFWTVMAFLPRMLQRNSGYIISVALGRSSLTNTGIMRTIHEELLQCDTKVKLSLIESNDILENYLPSLSSDILARLIIRSMWNFDTVIKVPSIPSYLMLLPVLFLRTFFRSVIKITALVTNRNR